MPRPLLISMHLMPATLVDTVARDAINEVMGDLLREAFDQERTVNRQVAEMLAVALHRTIREVAAQHGHDWRQLLATEGFAAGRFAPAFAGRVADAFGDQALFTLFEVATGGLVVDEMSCDQATEVWEAFADRMRDELDRIAVESRRANALHPTSIRADEAFAAIVVGEDEAAALAAQLRAQAERDAAGG